jgi:carboxymethylenebutenolidase
MTTTQEHTATTTSVRVDNGTMDIYWDGPARTSRGPAIVLMYHRGGIDDLTKGFVAKLKSAGYLVAVPEVSHRCPQDVPMHDRKKLLKDSEVLADIAATVAFLKARPDVAPDRIVIMGHCMGGRMALLGAGNLPGFKATVVYYGGSVMASWGDDATTPFDRLGDIAGPVIGFFGNDDVHPSPADVNKIDAELSKHGVAHTFHRYDNVGHGFQNPARTDPVIVAAAADSWEKTFAFLKVHAPA